MVDLDLIQGLYKPLGASFNTVFLLRTPYVQVRGKPSGTTWLSFLLNKSKLNIKEHFHMIKKDVWKGGEKKRNNKDMQRPTLL